MLNELIHLLTNTFPEVRLHYAHKVVLDESKCWILLLTVYPSKGSNCECECVTRFDHVRKILMNVFPSVLDVKNALDTSTSYREFDYDFIRDVIILTYRYERSSIIVKDCYVYEIFNTLYIMYDIHYNMKGSNADMSWKLSQQFSEYMGKRVKAILLADCPLNLRRDKDNYHLAIRSDDDSE